MRCEHGHEMNALRPLTTCPYPRCDGTPKPIIGPLTKRDSTTGKAEAR